MILIINGPNINMLGKRDKIIYGDFTYDELTKRLLKWSKNKNIEIEIFQSNIEGEIIDRIQEENYKGIIINCGAFTHYSYAISDALEIIDKIKIEVHISNIFSREEFRKNSVTAINCNAVITGMGIEGYILALEYIKSKIL